jgi:hypothetical protein
MDNFGKVIMKTRFLLIVFLALFLFGCQARYDREFFELAGTQDINKSIRLIMARSTPDQDSIVYGDSVGFVVENKSEYDIYFLASDDVKIFAFVGEIWIEIEDSPAIYLPSEHRYLPPMSDGMPSYVAISARPIFADLKKKTEVRVLVIGTVMQEGQPTDIKVAAYHKVWVEPQP